MKPESKAADFRKELYDSYVTGFTDIQPNMLASDLSSRWSWYENKYLPALKGLSRGDSILELGCGPGYMLEFLAIQGFSRVRGIDISQEQVDIAKRRGLNAETADVFHFLSTQERGLSAIIAVDFVEHFTKEESLKLFRLIHGALNQNGLLLIQTPNGQGLFPRQVIYDDLTHLTIFTPTSLRQVLSLVGFEEIRFIETGPVPKGLKGKIRKGVWELIKLLANALRRIEANKSQTIWTENLICSCNKAPARLYTNHDD
jgi:2-polyprenyl-3-methyl-5-hydroxy-6-metoxy-1,4-benzoquinol methylase